MRSLIFVALCLATVAAVPSNPQRIVGGSVTAIRNYPSIASLLWTSSGVIFTQSCAGTVLNTRAILTAAHCTFGDVPARWRVRLGSAWANSGGALYSLQSIINHPDYNSRTKDNDIALIHTATTINYVNGYVQPASISGANYNLLDNQIVWTAGWGSTTAGGSVSEQLRHVQVWTVNQGTCRQRYHYFYGDVVTDNMLCSGWLDVGGRDHCDGDSGSPLFHNGVLVGVYSWGRGCGFSVIPSVNTRVSRYAAWIQANV